MKRTGNEEGTERKGHSCCYFLLLFPFPSMATEVKERSSLLYVPTNIEVGQPAAGANLHVPKWIWHLLQNDVPTGVL